MPANKNRYSTGGGFEPPTGTLPGEGMVTPVDVTASADGAGRGNNYGSPINTPNGEANPGGYGSSGTKSSSRPA